MKNSSQVNAFNNTTGQQGNPYAGLQATAETSTTQKPLYTSLDWIDNRPGKEWRDASERLTLWTNDRLVNRTDVYRGYKLPHNRFLGELITYTKPFLEEAREFGSLTRIIVDGHYRGDDPGGLVGLHAISIDNTSRWFVINVDQQNANGAILADANANAAFGWHEELQQLEFRPLLLDANGVGGYHVLVCLSDEVPSQTVHAFVSEVVNNFAEYSLTQAPEVYPSEPDVNPHRPYGSWWRLPGKHHTREFWTKVWDGSRWLENQEAIEAILSVTGDSPDLIPGADDSLGQHGCDLPQFARFLLGERIEPEIVAEVCLLWDDVHNQQPSDEEQIRQTVRDLVQRG